MEEGTPGGIFGRAHRPPERILPRDERKELLNVDRDSESAVCAVSGHATSTRRSGDVRWKGKPDPTGSADQSAKVIEFPIDFMLKQEFIRKNDLFHWNGEFQTKKLIELKNVTISTVCPIQIRR